MGRCSAIWARKAGGKYFGGCQDSVNLGNGEVVPPLAQVIEGDEDSLSRRREWVESGSRGRYRSKGSDMDGCDGVLSHILQDRNDVGVPVDHNMCVKGRVEPENRVLTKGPFVLEEGSFLGLV